MTYENKDFLEYYNFINHYTDFIIKFRKENDSDEKDENKLKNELLSELEMFNDDVHIIRNEYCMNFLNLVWKNFNDKEKCLKEMTFYLNELNQKFNVATVIDKAIIAYQLLTKTAQDNFNDPSMKSKYIEAIKKIVLKRTRTFIKSNGNEKTYETVPVEKHFDKFGPWELDRFFGQMRLFLILPSNSNSNEYESYPPLWRTDEKTFLSIEEKGLKDPMFAQVNLNELTLVDFVKKELSIRDPKQIEDIMGIFKSQVIYSIHDLLNITDWDRISQLLSAHHNKIRNSLDKYRNITTSLTSNVNKREKTNSELLADWNKAKLFLFYEAEMKEMLANCGFIEKQALKEGFKEQREDKDYDGGPVLSEIEKVIEHFTEPNKPLRKNSHGLMLYGPPGTGKTELCKVIINKSGVFNLGVDPLSSSELNRSKVGETEQLLIAIFHRALHVPYLLCCIAIDEIDALTPKRNEKSGEHKVDVLCLLLSLIGGIKDVKNVFVIASTNRLNKIDDAFARRLENKFYVGRLNAQERIKIIEKINDKDVKLPPKYKNVLDEKSRKALIVTLTTNFSGAALASFRSRFLKYLDLNANINLSSAQIDKSIKELCAKVANDFQIKLGGYSIPLLLSDDKHNLNEIEDKLKLFFKQDDFFTGRVLIDLRSDFHNIQFELVDGGLKELELNKNKKYVDDLIPILLKLAFHLKVPYFQLVDSNLILSNSAFDENLMLEMVLEKLNEYDQYEDSMLIFDADTLVGVSESLSDSSFSPSSSYSIQNSRLWQNVLLHNFKSAFSKESSKNSKHKWFIIISSSEFLIDQLKKLTKFKHCEKEFELKHKERTCVNCDGVFTRENNKTDSCNFHPHKKLSKIIKVTNERKEKIELSKEELIELAKKNGNTDAFNDYYYLCCMKRLNESDGCKKDYHYEREVEVMRPNRYFLSESDKKIVM